MFPQRYFNPRYFAARYFAKLGAEFIPPPPPTFTPVSFVGGALAHRSQATIWPSVEGSKDF